METGRPLGDQRPVPRALTGRGLPPGRVEGERGGAEVAVGPRPFRLDEPQQVKEVVRRVGGPGGQPAHDLLQVGQQRRALGAVRCPGLPGQAQPAHRMGHGAVGEPDGDRQQRQGRRAVPGQAGLIAEDRCGDRTGEIDVNERSGLLS